MSPPKKTQVFFVVSLIMVLVVLFALLWLVNTQANRPYLSCAEAKADGRSHIPKGDQTYNPQLDRDADGLACE